MRLLRRKKTDPLNVTFTIRCTMRARWVPYFLGLLKRMQYQGGIGTSRWVHFFADGDGDFRPRFRLPSKFGEPAKPTGNDGDEAWWDAG